MNESYNLKAGKDYKTGRAVARLEEFVGWLSITIGGLVASGGLVAKLSTRSNDFGSIAVSTAEYFMLSLGIALFLGGLFAVAQAQGVRAQMDSAEYARKTLELNMNKLSLSVSNNDISNQTQMERNISNSRLQYENAETERNSTVPKFDRTWMANGWQIYKLSDGGFAIITADGWLRYNTYEDLLDVIGKSDNV